QNILARPPGAAVLDVRGAAEFAAGHVPGATHLAYTRLAAEADRLPSGSPLLVHCATGLRSAFAASWLEIAGREVIHLDGPVPDFPPTPPRSTTKPTAATP
ncbi:MAG: rhodanese-like domain-containing protein, partial [Verrucomicrobia bacterium]|nr:rhodanese-like domain-containing protein [Verrucomicrobiota bacterium]